MAILKNDRPRWDSKKLRLNVTGPSQWELICEAFAYTPVIDRPDWDNLDYYSTCGLWDLDENKNRIPYHPVIHSVKKCVQLMETRIPVRGVESGS